MLSKSGGWSANRHQGGSTREFNCPIEEVPGYLGTVCGRNGKQAST